MGIAVSQAGGISRGTGFGNTFGTVQSSGLAVHFAVISGTAGFACRISARTSGCIAAQIFPVAGTAGENITGRAGSIFIFGRTSAVITGNLAEIKGFYFSSRGNTFGKQTVKFFAVRLVFDDIITGTNRSSIRSGTHPGLPVGEKPGGSQIERSGKITFRNS